MILYTSYTASNGLILSFLQNTYQVIKDFHYQYWVDPDGAYIVVTLIYVVTSLLVLAAFLNFFRYRKGRVDKQIALASLIVAVSYSSTGYVIAFIYDYLLAGSEFAFLHSFLAYSVFDLLTCLSLLVIIPFTCSSRFGNCDLLPPVRLAVIFMLINSTLHFITFWKSVLVQWDDFYFIYIVYSFGQNINDILLCLTFFFPSFVSKHYKSIFQSTFSLRKLQCKSI